MVNFMLYIPYNKKERKKKKSLLGYKEKMQGRNENTDRMEKKSTEREDS